MGCARGHPGHPALASLVGARAPCASQGSTTTHLQNAFFSPKTLNSLCTPRAPHTPQDAVAIAHVTPSPDGFLHADEAFARSATDMHFEFEIGQGGAPRLRAAGSDYHTDGLARRLVPMWKRLAVAPPSPLLAAADATPTIRMAFVAVSTRGRHNAAVGGLDGAMYPSSLAMKLAQAERALVLAARNLANRESLGIKSHVATSVDEKLACTLAGVLIALSDGASSECVTALLLAVYEGRQKSLRLLWKMLRAG